MADLRFIHGDCVNVMRLLLSSERFHLIYIDPPFFSQQDYRVPDGEFAFSDRWRTLGQYVASVTDVCSVARSLLAACGSLVLHVDQKTSHYLKVELDRVFGREAFASEIVWRYRRWPTKTPNFQRVHDTLLRYVADPKAEPRWTQLYEPLAPSTVKTWGTGRQRAVVENGRRKRSSTTAEQSPGVAMGDVWEIPIIAPVSKERTGYPTQKPEALLERLISGLTHEGDSILDPMCGSGTTLAVARRLGRSAVGIDRSGVAIRYSEERLGVRQELGRLRSEAGMIEEAPNDRRTVT